METKTRSFRQPTIVGRILLVSGCLLFLFATAIGKEYVVESAKQIPVFRQVDVLVVGSSSGAVSCAVEAAEQGASVFLIAARPYLGTDICAKLRLWLEEDERADTKLARACYGDDRVTTPYKVKTAMDRALLEADVSWLTGCYPTDVLRDEDGAVAGIVMANRSGRQAIKAKVVIDATEQAVVARLVGARFRNIEPRQQTLQRVVIGGPMRTGENTNGEKKNFTADKKYQLPIYQYKLNIDITENSPVAMCRAENVARDMTYARGSESASETLCHIPSDTVVGQGPGALSPYRPAGIDRLYVFGPRSDIDRATAMNFMRPTRQMKIGQQIGRAAALEASGLPDVKDASVKAPNIAEKATIVVGENLGGIRASQLGTITSERQRLPVFGRYDVVVVGGGTSGAPAGISAAQGGAKTLVVEYLHELGGVGTVGLIGAYWRGLRRGFTARIDEEVNPGTHRWNAVEKAEWFRRQLTESGADVWFGVLACGTLVEDGKVRGVVVATPWGRGVVLADVTIDATGNADVAACGGAKTQYSISDRETLNVQVAGFPDRPIGNSYVNTCYTLVDDTDVLDVWHLMTWRRLTSGKESTHFDIGQLVDSRERRRIVGDYMLRTHDILNHRTFPDTISQHYSNFDAAAFPDANLLLVANAKGPDYHTDLPYRCLLPDSLDGILVVGLGCSADRDAMTLIRMQPDLQNQGYAAGLAAVEAAKLAGQTRKIDLKSLQQRLVDEEILDRRVLTDKDSYPMSDRQIEDAIVAILKPADTTEKLETLAVIVAHPDAAIPKLKTHYDKATDKVARIKYAQLLGILGDPTGAETLIRKIRESNQWGKGVPLTSERKTGNAFTDLDRLVIALGFSRSPEALDTLVEKLHQLGPDDSLSHYKAISLAIRPYLPCKSVAERLQQMLRKPGFTGFAQVVPVETTQDAGGGATAAPASRFLTNGKHGVNVNDAYKELIVATMLYRCGDPDGSAKAILQRYSQDIHGHFARYARYVLGVNE